MQKIAEMIKERASALLADGTVKRVVGWKEGELFYDETPAVFESVEALADFRYDGFSGANVSKYLINQAKGEGKVLALLKPCDTLSFNQLVKEHRINRDNVHVVGVECTGKLDIRKFREQGIKGIVSVTENGDTLTVKTLYGDKTVKKADVLLDKCVFCKGKEFAAADEVISTGAEMPEISADRFEQVAQLEKMSPEQRFDFWRNELSKCIRCNACRNVCPACSCIKCVFDNPDSGVSSKANTDTFEENMFHIIRAFHVAGRCTDCGECSRVCPQGIPLHLLNRKFIKDINELYGEYQAGADTDSRGPLTDYSKDDSDPGIVYERGGEQ